MNREEFADRTKKFLSEGEIERYEEDFEPAYMLSEGIDKDDFCRLLKDESARHLCVAFSKEVKKAKDRDRSYETEISQHTDTISSLHDTIRDLQGKLAEATRSLKLINATVDRALQKVPKWCVESELS